MENTHAELATILLDMSKALREMESVQRYISSCSERIETSITRADNFLKSTSHELISGKPFPNHDEAFIEARKCVKRHLKERGGDHSLSIQVLAVSASFSWPFITVFLPDVVRSHPTIFCEVEVLLVDPDHLSQVRVCPIRGTLGGRTS